MEGGREGGGGGRKRGMEKGKEGKKEREKGEEGRKGRRDIASPELCNYEREVGAHEGLCKYQFTEDVLVHQFYCHTQLLNVVTLLLCVMWCEAGRKK